MSTRTRLVCGSALYLAAAACESSGSGAGLHPNLPVVPGDGARDFVSDVDPSGSSRGGPLFGAPGDSSAGAGGGTSGGPPPAAPGGDPGQVIAEADIIQVSGDRLFALSRYSGLTVVDIGDPRDLRILGSHRSGAQPFEMYLKEGVAYVMLNGFGTYAYDDALGYSTWKSTARMQALDVSDPSRIRVIGDVPVPGEISDSRMVDSMLYLATYQDQYCYQCDGTDNTRITSFDTSDPATFRQVDELRFESPQNGWGKRSIAVTGDRIYVAGPHFAEVPTRGSIQIVDISDPTGRLSLGAEVSIAGSIESRWQMDEHEGVLRVVSQAGGWQSSTPPEVETFRVDSATAVTPLGHLQMVLPRPEDLQSVRFDGTRAYAVTFEQTDPLFTLDLSNPAAPRQLGELEIPGWLYHMEPRGDRLYALGFDDPAEGRGLTVSIFDVSNITAPRMLDRVVFGGQWASVAEDQDRIHKAFNLALDQGLILVPFSGSQNDPDTCTYDWVSGIQLIDAAGDDLVLRGVAPQIGEARRSLLHEGTLLGVGDNAVQAFDITNRDAPVELDRLEVARNVSSIQVMGDQVLRFGNDWYTGRTVLDFTSADDASGAEPTGELDLSSLLAEEENQCTSSSSWSGEVYVRGNLAYVPRHRYRWNSDGSGRSEQTMTIYVIDLSNRSAPRIVSSFAVEAATSSNHGVTYESESLGGVLLTDSALLVGRSSFGWDGGTSTQRHTYDVFSLESPTAPRFTTRFEVPSAIVQGGWGRGPMSCGLDMGWGWWFPGSGSGALVSGDVVASNHSVPLEGDPNRVRYYLDRVDVSNPDAPRMLPPVNIPGQATYFDAARGVVVTVEDRLDLEPAVDWSDCQWRSARAWLDADGTCRVYRRQLSSLVLEGSLARRLSQVSLDDGAVSLGLAFSSDRVFVVSADPVPYSADGMAPPPPRSRQLSGFVLAPSGQLQRLPDVDLGQSEYHWWPNLVARGPRAFLTGQNELTVVDTSSLASPTVTRHEMAGYSCTSLQVSADRAYCAMHEYGVASFDL